MTTESLTVEQTNALRQKLGLPPLTTATSPSPSSSPAPPSSDDPAPSISTLRAELARRQAARHASAVLSTTSLSSQLQFSTAGSAAAWIERHRRVAEEEAKRREERRLAEAERAKAGDPQYDASHLRGLRIVHSYDAFEDEGEKVLVLKDKRIGEEDDDDELVNAELDDRERRLEAAGKGSKKGWEDDDRPSLLAKYDEDEGTREGIVLGGGGQYGRAEEEKRRRTKEDEERRELMMGGWGDASSGRVEYDVSQVERKVDSEYLEAKPAEVTFKRKKDRKKAAGDDGGKSRSHRHKKTEEKAGDDWMQQLEDEAKRGVTGQSSKEAEERERRRSEEERKEKKTQGYLRALEKGEEETRRRLERDKQEGEELQRRRLAVASAADVEEEDEELALAVERARRLTQREKLTATVKVKVEGQEEGREVKLEPVSGIKALAERIASERAGASVKREGVKVEGLDTANGLMGGRDEDDDDGIVFTSVSNFASGLTVPEDSGRAKREEAEATRPVKREPMAATMDVDDLGNGHQTNGTHSDAARNGSSRHHQADHVDEDEDEENDDGVKEEDGEDGEEEDEEEDDDEDVFGDEPLASGGIASALALAQRRAYISSAPSEPAVGFNLAQYDALGRELSAKEKFRLLSHGFHGQGAGINKSDKRERSRKREVGLLQRVREKETQGVGQDNKLLLEAQRRLGQAYLVLDGAKPTGSAPTPAGGSLSRTGGTESESRKRVKR